MDKKKLIASLLLGLATLLWGLSYTIQSISARDLGTYTIVFFKTIGALFLIPFIIVKKCKFTKDTFIGGVMIGISVFAGCILQQEGMMLSSVSKASFITVLYIIFVPIISFFLGNKIKRKMIIAIVLALIGLYFLCIKSDFSLNIGDFYLILCSLCFSLQILLIDHYSKKTDPLSLALISQLFTGLFSLVMMLIYEKPDFQSIKAAILPIMFIVFMSGLIAQTIQNVYQKDLDPSLASLIMSFESVFGAIFGWLILNQTLSVKEIFGCILLFIAILIAE